MAIRTYDVVDYANIPPGRWSIGPLKAVQITLTPAEIRTLNSLPIDLVVPANANTFLAPGQCVFVGAQGSGAYSAALSPAVQYSDASYSVVLDNNWDGSAPLADVIADLLIEFSFANPLNAQLGLALQVTSAGDVTGGDVTGGDAPCTIDLIYREYTLTGLL